MAATRLGGPRLIPMDLSGVDRAQQRREKEERLLAQIAVLEQRLAGDAWRPGSLHTPQAER